MARRNGDILRVALQVNGAVALRLVGVAAGLSIEEIDVVHPNVPVLGVERYGVVHTQHVAEVAQLYALGIPHQDAKAAQGGIVAYTFNGDVQWGISRVALHLQAFRRTAQRAHVLLLQQSDYPHTKRCGGQGTLTV